MEHRRTWQCSCHRHSRLCFFPSLGDTEHLLSCASTAAERENGEYWGVPDGWGFVECVKYFWAELFLGIRGAGCTPGSENLSPAKIKHKLRTKRHMGAIACIGTAPNDQNDTRGHKYPLLDIVLRFHSYRPLWDKWEIDFSPASVKGCPNLLSFCCVREHPAGPGLTSSCLQRWAQLSHSTAGNSKNTLAVTLSCEGHQLFLWSTPSF